MVNWQFVLLDPARVMLIQIGQFLNALLLVICILILGWIVARIVKSAATSILKALKADYASERINLEGLLEKGGIKYSLSELVGIGCYWIILLITFMMAANAVQLSIVADLLNRVVLYVPHVIAAVFVLVVAMFISVLLKNVIQAASANIGIAQANLLTKVAEIVVMVFAVLIALEQLKIGAMILEKVILVAVASIGLAAALAFGLGCKEIAGKITGDLLDKVKSKK